MSFSRVAESAAFLGNCDRSAVPTVAGVFTPGRHRASLD